MLKEQTLVQWNAIKDLINLWDTIIDWDLKAWDHIDISISLGLCEYNSLGYYLSPKE